MITESETHVKLARLSASLAGRLFSTDEESGHEVISVRGAHVKYVSEKLDQFYSDKNMQYNQYSFEQRDKHTLGDMNKIESLLNQCDRKSLLTVENLSKSRLKTIFSPYIISEKDKAVMDRNFSLNDSIIVDKIVHDMVKLNALAYSAQNSYKKTRRFSEYLVGRYNSELKYNSKVAKGEADDTTSK